jgi:cytochrome b561
MKKIVSRYHPVLAALHWVLAALLLGMLLSGFFGLSATENTNPAKLAVLRWHMQGGMLVLALMVLRFVFRAFTAHPPRAQTGRAVVDRSVSIVHVGFYVIVVLAVASGFATGILAGLPAIVFGGSGDPLPNDFSAYPTAALHTAVAALLAALIAVHLVALVYHRFVRGDRILGRMLFGRRTVRNAAALETQP